MRILIVEDQFIEAYDLQLILEKTGYTVTGIASTFKEAIDCIEKDKPDLVCLDIFIRGAETGIDLAKKIKGSGIGFVYISANSSKNVLNEAKTTNPYGFIVKPFREQDIVTTLEIASYRHKHNAESMLDHINTLQNNINAINGAFDNWETTFVQLGNVLQTYLPFDYMEFGPADAGQGYKMNGLIRRNFRDYKIITPKELATLTKLSAEDLKNKKSDGPVYDEPMIYEAAAFIKECNTCAIKRGIAESFGIRSFFVQPVILQEKIYHFFFYSRQPECFTENHLALVSDIKPSLSGLIGVLNEPVTENKKPDPKKNNTIPAVNLSDTFEGIVGSSKNMLNVYDSITKVAPSDTSVLILGESGTGKEQVARCIHNLSLRKNKPFVTINCGAIPANLAESLLFGHEKGAFTGATEKQLGKFELADNGTIFLDEIGEMPIDLQVKLLRVLQENEIERIGGHKPIKINARIIAATNKNLEDEVTSGKFRMDLYYRLHVFPIIIPPLRERKDDIIALASYFIQTYSNKLNKRPVVFSANVLEQIMSYNWPGNVRQLEHAIQRSIILAEGDTIKEIQLPKSQQIKDSITGQEFYIDSIKTIQEMEREYIYYILKKCKGKVYGAGGAAELLDLPPSTLNSKMKKLGISVKLMQ
ncbi:sigma 54-interacting transcriptional regulator [Flavobacterium hauense]